MPREEKGSPMGSYDNSGSGSEGGSSLAARRARLRGSLARASYPPDEEFPQAPGAPDPASGTTETPVAASVAAEPPEDQSSQFDPTAMLGSGGSGGTNAITSALSGAMGSMKSRSAGVKSTGQVTSQNAKVSKNNQGNSEPPSTGSEPYMPESQPLAASAHDLNQQLPTPEMPAAYMVEPQSMPHIFDQQPVQQNYDQQPAQQNYEQQPAQQNYDQQPGQQNYDQQLAQQMYQQQPAPQMQDQQPPQPGQHTQPIQQSQPSQNSMPVTVQPFSQAPLQPLPAVPEQAVELLTSIDSALNACATNLAALQRLSVEQTDVLKGLTTTLQNQTLFEIGLNLNSLTESLTAALEPMKAIGELVPAMDQLVTTLEGRETTANNEKLSPDQLVTSLADQLSAGLIDPWTFKCAYMAIYPSEHPADLLHRLVELLGTQRLSGDLFRAAYEAVQAAEPPTRSFKSASGSGGGSESGSGSIDAEIRHQIEELQRANEELSKRQEERERELGNMLHQKEAELSEAQELLNSRYDEFNSRYEEVADALNKREEEYRALLESKDMELVEKESELNLLRAQMEELRNQTEEMVKDLQKQMTDAKIAKEEQQNYQQKTGGFFDPAPQPARNLFENGQPKPLFEQAPQMVQQPQQQQGMQQQAMQQPMQQQVNSGSMPIVQAPQSQTSSQSMPVQQAPQVPQAPMSAGAPPTGVQNTANRPAPQPAPTTPFTPGAGSYGSGVRAQVFEVIVRQALAGAPWREICAGPMQVNNISPEEVEAEVKRRQALLNK